MCAKSMPNGVMMKNGVLLLQISMLLKLRGSSQQSVLNGKGDSQLLLPQTRSSLQSLSESQSPWLMPHWLDGEQQVKTSSLMALQISAEKWIYIL